MSGLRCIGLRLFGGKNGRRSRLETAPTGGVGASDGSMGSGLSLFIVTVLEG